MSTFEAIFSSASIFWPLVFLISFILILNHVREDVKPIFRGIVGGLTIQAQNNSVAWAVVIGIALLGSSQELIAVAKENNWPYVEAFARIFTPFIAGLVAGSRVSPTQSGSVATVNLPAGDTTSKVTVEQTTTAKSP